MTSNKVVTAIRLALPLWLASVRCRATAGTLRERIVQLTLFPGLLCSTQELLSDRKYLHWRHEILPHPACIRICYTLENLASCSGPTDQNMGWELSVWTC